MGSTGSPGRRAALRFANYGLVYCSILLAGLLAACYALRSDWIAAVTVFPPWAWVVVGFGLPAFRLLSLGRRSAVLVTFVWLVFLLAFADHPAAMFRYSAWPAAQWAAARYEGRGVRVISLNCASSAAAAREVAALQPDIVLLQESPDRPQLEALARQLFGDEGQALYGVDASLVARGPIEPRKLARNLASYAVQARVRLANGREVEVACLRLEYALVRIDLWAPECWRAQRANRRRRRDQLAGVLRGTALQGTGDAPTNVPVIVGGDFNAPPGDAIYRLLSPRFRDAFASGGRGWGNTIVNNWLPFSRIDQVWTSDAFVATDVFSAPTLYSDHRMVVCDLVLK